MTEEEELAAVMRLSELETSGPPNTDAEDAAFDAAMEASKREEEEKRIKREKEERDERILFGMLEKGDVFDNPFATASTMIRQLRVCPHAARAGAGARAGWSANMREGGAHAPRVRPRHAGAPRRGAAIGAVCAAGAVP